MVRTKTTTLVSRPTTGVITPKIQSLKQKLNKATSENPANDSNNDPALRRKRKTRPGVKALREIKKYQMSTEMLLPRGPFKRLVREIGAEYATDLKMQPGALQALQESTENYMIQTFQLANISAIHAGRQNVMKRDMKFVDDIKDILK